MHDHLSDWPVIKLEGFILHLLAIKHTALVEIFTQILALE